METSPSMPGTTRSRCRACGLVFAHEIQPSGKRSSGKKHFDELGIDLVWVQGADEV